MEKNIDKSTKKDLVLLKAKVIEMSQEESIYLHRKSLSIEHFYILLRHITSNTISDRKQFIIFKLYYGLDDFLPKTHREIGEKFEFSFQWINQVINKVFKITFKNIEFRQEVHFFANNTRSYLIKKRIKEAKKRKIIKWIINFYSKHHRIPMKKEYTGKRCHIEFTFRTWKEAIRAAHLDAMPRRIKQRYSIK